MDFLDGRKDVFYVDHPRAVIPSVVGRSRATSSTGRIRLWAARTSPSSELTVAHDASALLDAAHAGNPRGLEIGHGGVE